MILGALTRANVGFLVTDGGSGEIGVDGIESSNSTVSICAAEPLELESNDACDLTEPMVPRLCCRYLLTSMRLLKYSVRQVSSLRADPLVSGMATSRHLSLTNL